jgi:hypothetical protein
MPKMSTASVTTARQQNALRARAGVQTSVERETGFEPATSTLARSHSTAELLPLSRGHYKRAVTARQTVGFGDSCGFLECHEAQNSRVGSRPLGTLGQRFWGGEVVS